MYTSPLTKGPLFYWPSYRKITGDIYSSILLSFIVNYPLAEKPHIVKTTNKMISYYTGLLKKEIKTAKKHLKKLPFITIQELDNPKETVFKLNPQKLFQMQFGEKFH